MPTRSSRLLPRLSLLAAAAGLASMSPAASADEPDYGTVITPLRGPGSAFDVDRSVYVLGDDQLRELQPMDPVEAIEALPGVQPQRTQRGAGAPILRGLIGPQNLILVDGVRLSTSIYRTGPNQYAALVDPMALEAVEVVLGPGSVLYGSDALGGTVAYHTLALPDEEGWWGRTTARFASADLGRALGLTAGGRKGAVAGWLGGAFRMHGALRTGDGESLPNSDYLEGDWRAKLGADLGRGWRVTGTWLGTRLPDAVRMDTIGQGDQREYDNLDQLAFIDLRRVRPRALVSDVGLTLGYHHVTDRVDRYLCETDADDVVLDLAACRDRERAQLEATRRTIDTVDALTGSATLTLQGPDRRFRVITGLDGTHEWIGSQRWDGRPDADFALVRRDRGNFSDGSTHGSLGAFAHGEGRLGLSRDVEGVLTAGARLTHITASAPDVPGLGQVDYGFTGLALTAGARAILWQRANLYFNYSQGFRAPNLQEATVLGDTGSTFEIPNDALGPERSDTFEVGVKWHSRWLRLSGAVFSSTVSDAIVREAATWEGQSEVDGKPVFRRTNATEASFRGLELAGTSGRWQGLSLFGSVSAIEGTITTRDGDDEPARRVPPLNGMAGVRWDGAWKQAWVRAAVRWAAEQDRLAPGDRKDLRICGDPTRPGRLLADCEGTEGWAALSLRGGLQATDALRLDLAVENVLDASYRWHGSGLDAPGVDAQLSATYQW